MFWGNISKDFTAINMEKATGLSGYVYQFSANYNIIDTGNIINIYKCLMKKTWYKIMFRIIKKMFIKLLTGPVSSPNYAKCVSLSNQKCEIQLTFINLHPNEYSQEFHY